MRYNASNELQCSASKNDERIVGFTSEVGLYNETKIRPVEVNASCPTVLYYLLQIGIAFCVLCVRELR